MFKLAGKDQLPPQGFYKMILPSLEEYGYMAPELHGVCFFKTFEIAI
jgi:hypothetical protein